MNKTDSKPTTTTEVDTLAWLDGLAGREGEGGSHAEGSRLRDSLLGDTQAEQPQPSWQEIAVRAHAGANVHAASAPTTPAPAAANQPRWRVAAGALAVGVVAVAVVLWMPQRDDTPDTLRGAASQPTWRTPEPQAAAGALAAELRALGARVEVRAAPPCVRLLIEAIPAASARVAERLREFETAPDPNGRAQLDVCPAL